MFDCKISIRFSIKIFLFLFISVIYLLGVISLTPGGWSPDSLSALNKVLSETTPSNIKPIWYVLIWRALLPISSDAGSIMFLFQNFVYLVAAIGLGMTISRNFLFSISTIIFLLIYPAFLGVNYSNWTNSLSLGLFVVSVALLLQYTLHSGRSYLAALSIIFVLLAAAVRWESALMIWPVIMIVFFSRVVKNASTPRTIIGGIFMLFSASLVASILFLALNQATTDRLSVGGRERLSVWTNTKYLVYISAEQNMDLIADEFKSEKLKGMPLNQKIEFYKRYRMDWQVYKIRKIVDNKVFNMTNRGLGKQFLIHSENVFRENRLTLIKIKVSEIAHRLLKKGYTYAALSDKNLNQVIKRLYSEENQEGELRESINLSAHKRIKDYLRSARSFGFYRLFAYVVAGIILFGISTIVLVSRVLKQYSSEMLIRPYVSLVFSSYFLGLLVALSVLSGNLEFRYFIPGIFSLFVATLVVAPSICQVFSKSLKRILTRYFESSC